MRITYGTLVKAIDKDDGTDLLIHTNECLSEILKRRCVSQIEVGYDDGRRISIIQRRKIYAILHDISDHTGYDPESAKQIMKNEHMMRVGEYDHFSLSDCSMSTAREFINTLMDYCLREGIILTDTGLLRTDDIDTYLIQCIKYKKCCICGRYADIHHVDAIGMGNNRCKVNDSDREIMALCRNHHSALHNMGNSKFMRMYAVYGIVRKRVEEYVVFSPSGFRYSN